MRFNSAIQAARDILDGKADLVNAIRQICAIGFDFDKIPEFHPFHGFYSEMNAVSGDDARGRYSGSLLERLDRETAVFLRDNKEYIEGACQELIRALQNDGAPC